MSEIILHLTCPDQLGIIAQLTQLLYISNANIISLEQHVEPAEKLFFMRVHANLKDLKVSYNELVKSLEKIENNLSGKLTINNPSKPLKMAILCTKEQAHVSDLLMKSKSGELNCDIPIVISNHNYLRDSVEPYGIAYHHFPIKSKMRDLQEKKIVSVLKSHSIDIIVLARYMQILSPQFVDLYKGRIINIHHAFLPAFKGEKPYHKAWNCGVKVIGATAHYVTKELDEGPIIEQDVESVTHQYSVSEMIQAGRDIERRVLTSAVKAHLQHRILLHGKRTLIFHS